MPTRDGAPGHRQQGSISGARRLSLQPGPPLEPASLSGPGLGRWQFVGPGRAACQALRSSPGGLLAGPEVAVGQP